MFDFHSRYSYCEIENMFLILIMDFTGWIKMTPRICNELTQNKKKINSTISNHK